jgi:hypothetical protein
VCHAVRSVGAIGHDLGVVQHCGDCTTCPAGPHIDVDMQPPLLVHAITPGVRIAAILSSTTCLRLGGGGCRDKDTSNIHLNLSLQSSTYNLFI